MAKIFISSVMRGFENERQTAAKYIRSAGHQPVMAEEFGPKPHSSEEACLSGVRDSDWFMLILGERYGWVAPSGRSVTEEEYREAKSTRKAIVVLVREGDKEPKQADFVQEVSDYKSGFFRGSFTSPSDLGPQVVQAITALEASAAGHPEESRAVQRLLGLQSIITREDRASGTRLELLLAPVHRDDLFRIETFGNDAFTRDLQKAALFGSPGIFQSSMGTTVEEGREHVAILQTSARGEHINRVEVFVDGAMRIVLTVRPPNNEDETSRFSHFGTLVVDEQCVRAQIAAAIRFGADVLGGDLCRSKPKRVLLRCGLRGIAGKSFGASPKRSASISLPGRELEDPLWVPVAPISLDTDELSSPDGVTTKVTALLARAFKAVHAYRAPGDA